MAFDRIEFFRVCMDIEKYLGYLRGNELATEYLESVNSSTPPSPDLYELYDEHGVSLRDWSTPCPDGQWKVRPHGGYGGPTSAVVWVPFNATESELSSLDNEIRTNLTTAYTNGLGWADGLAMYLNDLCQKFSHVDTDAMANAVLDLKTEVVGELAFGARDQWTELGQMLNNWNGEGAHAFFNFHANYGSALELFSVMSAQITGGFAGATAVIHGTQEAAMAYVESVRAALEIMLAFWVECGLTTPPDPGAGEVDIANILAIANDVRKLLNLIPPVKVALSAVNTGVDAITTLTSLIGRITTGESTPELHIEPHQFTDWTANGLYQAIAKQVHEEIYLKYDQAMDELYNGDTAADPTDADNAPFRAKSLEDAMKELQGARNEWELPTVPPRSLNENGAPYGY